LIQPAPDYLFSLGPNIIPVEVKAGKSGSLKSLHVFINEKKHHFALRFNSDVPSMIDTTTRISGQPSHPFRLLSLPMYLIDQTKRLCRETI